MEAELASTVVEKEFKRFAEESETHPVTLLGVPQKHQAKSHNIQLKSCSFLFSLCEPIWALLSLFSAPCSSPGVLHAPWPVQSFFSLFYEDPQGPRGGTLWKPRIYTPSVCIMSGCASLLPLHLPLEELSLKMTVQGTNLWIWQNIIRNYLIDFFPAVFGSILGLRLSSLWFLTIQAV